MKATLSIAAAVCTLALVSLPVHAQSVPPATTPGIASKLIVRGDLQGLQVFDLRSQPRNEVIVVQAELYNNYDRDARLYYRFRWVDDGGMQVGDGETWKPLIFLGRQSQFIRGTAPGPKATDFFIEMSAEPR